MGLLGKAFKKVATATANAPAGYMGAKNSGKFSGISGAITGALTKAMAANAAGNMAKDEAKAKDEAMRAKDKLGAGSIGMLAMVKKQGKGMGPIGKLMQARATKTPMFKKGGAVAKKTGKGKAMGVATRGGGRALMKGK
jgi:hypothetical protein